MTADRYDGNRSHLFEDSTAKKDAKKSKKKKNKKAALQGVSPTIWDKYKGLETKSNVNNSLIKSLVDILAAGLVGPALSAALGKYSPLAGIALSFGGHYTDDQSGLMRGIGMSTIAHAVAKAKEYRETDSTLQNRLSELKDDWLSMILLGNSNEKKTVLDGVEAVNGIEPLPENKPLEAESENHSSIEQELADFEENTQSFLEDQAMEFESENDQDEEFDQDEENQEFETSPFLWKQNNWEQSNPFEPDEHLREFDFPDDLDFSQL